MRIRGNRRRRNYDRGFVMSDHADWPALLATIRDTGARRVIATHGHGEALVRLLAEQGLRAEAFDMGDAPIDSTQPPPTVSAIPGSGEDD